MHKYPSHKHRPRRQPWTKEQSIRHAQITSERQRKKQEVTLPKAPWMKEREHGPDNGRL
jgi:hypothetical protein